MTTLLTLEKKLLRHWGGAVGMRLRANVRPDDRAERTGPSQPGATAERRMFNFSNQVSLCHQSARLRFLSALIFEVVILATPPLRIPEFLAPCVNLFSVQFGSLSFNAERELRELFLRTQNDTSGNYERLRSHSDPIKTSRTVFLFQIQETKPEH